MYDHYAAAQLQARRIAEQTGLSLRQIAELPMDEYARVTGRLTPTQAAIAALDAQHEDASPQQPERPPEPAPSEPQGLDPNSDDYFHAWRANRVRGGEGFGIFGGSGLEQSKTAFGRTAYSQSNVEPPARIERVFIQESPVQGRTMGYRDA